MHAALATYGAYAALSFQRMFAYRVANLAGIFTNTFFLLFRAYALSAFYVSGTQVVVGLNVKGVQSYVTITQALIMVIPQWGMPDLGESVRSGQIAMDLSRPVSFYGMFMSKQFGTSAYYMLVRCLPILAIGAAFGLLEPPADAWLIIPALISVVLAAWISYSLFFLMEATSFWLEQSRGARFILYSMFGLFGGQAIPVTFLPGWLAAISAYLPFQYTLFAPVAVVNGGMGDMGIWEILGAQLFWVVAMAGLCLWVFARGTKKLTIHGG